MRGPVDGLLIGVIAAALPPAQPLAPTTPNPERAWWQLQDGYILDRLIDHMLTAERTASAEAVASDLRWVETRLAQRGPTAPLDGPHPHRHTRLTTHPH